MGPIDFSKFNDVVDEYVLYFDLDEMASRINGLKVKHARFTAYIDLLNSVSKLEMVLKGDPKKLKILKIDFDTANKFIKSNCLNPPNGNGGKNCGSCMNCLSNQKTESFHQDLSAILNYSGTGKTNLRKIHSKIGMKACYICNSQYAVVAEPEAVNLAHEKQERYSAKFQFDHYLPQSLYPCFSLSLYNLFPICSSCNNIKSNHDIGIDFWEVDFNRWEGIFEFKLVESSLSNFLLKKKELSIEFTDKNEYPSEVKKKIAERFDIRGIYNSQKDEAEELIMRKLRYSEVYKKTLTTEFPEMFKSNSIDERIMLGFYSKKEGIHKRPLSKFLQDINKQLDDYFQSKIKTI